MNFTYFNPNPDHIITGDCIIRAGVVASNAPYNYIKENLKDKKLNSIVDCYKMLGAKTFSVNHVPATTICSFCEKFPQYNYVLVFGNHCAGIRENTLYDLFDCRIKDKNVEFLSVFNLNEAEENEFLKNLEEHIYNYLFENYEKWLDTRRSEIERMFKYEKTKI